MAQEESLKKEIARLAFTAASKLQTVPDKDRENILASLNLYTQAMILADDASLHL